MGTQCCTQRWLSSNLFEKESLGGGQTLASQGIIRSGLKYALQGTLSSAAQAIADMPSRWRACLDGSGEMDLRGTRVLSDHYYMWSSGSLRSRLKTFLGSKSLRGRVGSRTRQLSTLLSKRFGKGKPASAARLRCRQRKLRRNSRVETKGAIFSLPDSGVSFEISDHRDRVASFYL